MRTVAGDLAESVRHSRIHFVRQPVCATARLVVLERSVVRTAAVVPAVNALRSRIRTAPRRDYATACQSVVTSSVVTIAAAARVERASAEKRALPTSACSTLAMTRSAATTAVEALVANAASS